MEEHVKMLWIATYEAAPRKHILRGKAPFQFSRCLSEGNAISPRPSQKCRHEAGKAIICKPILNQKVGKQWKNKETTLKIIKTWFQFGSFFSLKTTPSCSIPNHHIRLLRGRQGLAVPCAVRNARAVAFQCHAGGLNVQLLRQKFVELPGTRGLKIFKNDFEIDSKVQSQKVKPVEHVEHLAVLNLGLDNKRFNHLDLQLANHVRCKSDFKWFGSKLQDQSYEDGKLWMAQHRRWPWSWQPWRVAMISYIGRRKRPWASVSTNPSSQIDFLQKFGITRSLESEKLWPNLLRQKVHCSWSIT